MKERNKKKKERKKEEEENENWPKIEIRNTSFRC